MEEGREGGSKGRKKEKRKKTFPWILEGYICVKMLIRLTSRSGIKSPS